MRSALPLAALVCACSPEALQQMETQRKVRAYAESPLFEDGRAMRTPPAGTVPRGGLAPPRPAVTRALLTRGQQRFEGVFRRRLLGHTRRHPVHQLVRIRRPT